ncbi:MAG: hypothetical protein LBR79_02120 [Oscillospiraceae bacterium]|nr:hypothetical protein [Oscillospiraceae bacterium]
MKGELQMSVKQSLANFFKKLSKKQKSDPKIIGKGEIALEDQIDKKKIEETLKDLQQGYLDKTKAQIAKMNVRDITMALRQINTTCINEIKNVGSVKKSGDQQKITSTFAKMVIIVDKSIEYISELSKKWETGSGGEKEALKEVKKTPLYIKIIQNFNIAYRMVNKNSPGSLAMSPKVLWYSFMNQVK